MNDTDVYPIPIGSTLIFSKDQGQCWQRVNIIKGLQSIFLMNLANLLNLPNLLKRFLNFFSQFTFKKFQVKIKF